MNRQAASYPTPPILAAPLESALGHQDSFPRLKLSARYPLSQWTFAGTRQTYKMRRFRPWYRRPPLLTADKRLTAFFNREVMFFLV